MFLILLRVDVGRWRSIVQAEKWSHYLSLVRTVVRRFSKVPI
jgi:hypothetical protein